MLEILFGESEAGSMKVAKSRAGIMRGGDGPIAVWGNPDMLPEQKDWLPVEGTPDEVFCFPYMLDIGDIREAFDSPYREELIFSMYMQSGWDNSLAYQNELRADIRKTFTEYNRFLKRAETGEPVRVWVSSAAYSQCGLRWFCRRMTDMKNPVYVMELPAYREDESRRVITRYKNWGEIAAEEFSSFLNWQKPLSETARRMYAMEWAELEKDNSPLRASVNGQLVGVSEDFYDDWILKRLTKKPVKEARLIGDILGLYPVSVSDYWYAARIEKMIGDGRIRVLQDSEKKYTRQICRA